MYGTNVPVAPAADFELELEVALEPDLETGFGVGVGILEADVGMNTT